MNSQVNERSSSRETARENVTPLKRRDALDQAFEPQRSGKAKWVILGLLLILVLAAGAFFLRGKNTAATAAKASETPAAPQTIEITSAAAVTRNLPKGVEVVGSLAADEEVVVSAQIAGELASLNVDFGSYVQQGQIIGQIDQRDAKLKLEQSEAQLKQTMARLGMREGERFDPSQNADVQQVKAQLDWAQMDFDRATKLVEKGDVPRSVYDQAMTNRNMAKARYQAALDGINQQVALIEQQRAAINLARKSLTDTVVRAPISGAVKEKHVARGSYLAVGNKIVTLVKTNPLRLRADIPESSAAAVQLNQNITLAIDAFPERKFEGRVVRIGPSLDEKTRALTVEAQVANPSNQLRPGMFAKSQLITNQNASVIMVPQKAILTTAGLSKVFVIENGKAHERIIKTGATDGDLIEIVSGVNSGEIVATSNLDKLQEGSQVKN
ncbi:MAG TPA: efflux RND transporter periplasmic adaptor subunit [Blastocatellia bacterium]|nr:efflux RND transporter periplasmic adaptor subunit [Blastocatellia bacterium]